MGGKASSGGAVPLGLFDRLFVALAAHLITVPPVIPDQLEALVGDVLDDGGDEITGAEHLKITVCSRVVRMYSNRHS